MIEKKATLEGELCCASATVPDLAHTCPSQMDRHTQGLRVSLPTAPWINGIGHIDMLEEIKHESSFESTEVVILHGSCPLVPLWPGISTTTAQKMVDLPTKIIEIFCGFFF